MSAVAFKLAREKAILDGVGSSGNIVKYLNQDFEALKSQCLHSGTLFKDEQFPACPSSLGYKELGPYFSKTQGIIWKRPQELVPNPQFIEGGATRTDICQGVLGDCWVLAAVASLTLNKAILEWVVPNDQSFQKDYAGIFHFKFWQYGEWLDVIVDDRLPTKNGQLVYLFSKERNEFWGALLEKAYAKMSFSDFKKQFTNLEICNLSPDLLTCNQARKWNMKLLHGTWQSGSTAGGSPNYPVTYWTNPQFKIKLEEPDDDQEANACEPCCTMIVGLMQKNRRRQKMKGEDWLKIGYCIYQLKNQANVHLSREFFSTNKPVVHFDREVCLREASSRFHLPQGDYFIVPYTSQPFQNGHFFLRIFSVKQIKAQEIGDTATANPYEPQVTDKDIDNEFKTLFQTLSGEDCELTADELQTILNRVITKRIDIKCDGFNINTCREMISLLDNDGTGILGLVEFKILWMKIQKYLEIYKKVDMNCSGTIEAHEMRNALKEAGFNLSNKIQQSIIIRYACSKLAIDFDGFVACMIRLECLFKMFQILDKDKDGTVQLSLTEWLCSALI
ncbi:PREDICTED: calpain-8-like isoform X2 [Thamnophis sirtalis]|uniref:calpain-2 n=1 Tax=Thamnophis sirtalis TaxID=35019 RepID=A0A6I9Y2Q6_9SAUR|nr:PREDICTED: calpain-8-like isoform X2 [Thamnophis sirtalis]